VQWNFSNLDAMKGNWGMTLGMQQLSLANKQIPEILGNILVAILASIRHHSTLKRMSLANIGVITGPLLHELAVIPELYWVSRWFINCTAPCKI